MKTAAPTELWSPVRADGTLDETELRRPAETPKPTTWQIHLAPSTSLASAGAVFGAAAWSPRHAFDICSRSPLALFRWADLGPMASSWLVDPRRPGHDPHVLLALEYYARCVPVQPFNEDTARAWPLPNITIIGGPVATPDEAVATLAALAAVPAVDRLVMFARPGEIVPTLDEEELTEAAAPVATSGTRKKPVPFKAEVFCLCGESILFGPGATEAERADPCCILCERL